MSIDSCRILTLSSGKGGVGKTSITVNTGLALVQKGYKVCLFDADINLANINIMLKQVPEYTLEHVINGEKSVTEIMQQQAGLYVVPGASGISDFISFDGAQKKRVLQAIEVCREVFDFILIDAAAGISKSVFSFMQIAQQNILVITPEPTSLTDAFSLLKVFIKQNPVRNFSVISNQVAHAQQAENIYKRFSTAVEKYIGVNVDYIGGIVKNDDFSKSICVQKPFFLEYPNAISSSNFRDIAEIICCRKLNLSASKAIDNFIKINTNKAPDFSQGKISNKVISLQKKVLKKLDSEPLDETQWYAVLDIINKKNKKTVVINKININDRDAMLSSMKYARLSADI